MNEMYNMSIVSHYYSVVGILIVILVNFIFLRNTKDLNAYKRKMSLFTPIGSTAIGGIIFTGVIMMAAKHLEFSVENIIMIVFSLFIIVLEVKRLQTLKYLREGFDDYKKKAGLILLYEAFLTISISLWMLV